MIGANKMKKQTSRDELDVIVIGSGMGGELNLAPSGNGRFSAMSERFSLEHVFNVNSLRPARLAGARFRA